MFLLLAELMCDYTFFAISSFQAKHLERVCLCYLDTHIKVIMTLCAIFIHNRIFFFQLQVDWSSWKVNCIC